MTKKYAHIFTAGILLFSLSISAQTEDKELKKANKLYNDYAYFKSIDIYKKVASQGYRSIELFEKLGDSYFFNAEYPEANKWYEELFMEKKADIEPIYYYRYSQTLKSVNQLQKAQQYLEQYSALNQVDPRSKEYIENKSYFSDIEEQSKNYKVNIQDINTAFSDYGVFIYDNRAFFTSSRPEKSSSKDKWTSDSYSALYEASSSDFGNLTMTDVFAPEIHTKYHEADPILTKDGKTMFFTRNSDIKRSKTPNNAVFLKIYSATLKNNKWTDVTELSFNNNLYSCAHPALSPDEKTLYFVSNMPGGFGDSDIYKVAIDSSNYTYGEPVNLGKNINTPGKETFPWVSPTGDFYFSSDGHLGLGGLDIFMAKITNDNYNTSKIVNLGKPLNSSFDDFGFVSIKDSKYGFFTSNREGGKGKDDIYGFEKITQDSISIQVVDDITKKGIASASIMLYDSSHTLIKVVKSDNNGIYKDMIEPSSINGSFYIEGKANDYDANEIAVTWEGLKKGAIIGLKRSKLTLDKGVDLAKLLNIKNIMFDFNKSDIRAGENVELAKLLIILNEYPKMKIDIRSHTDSRGSSESNMLLSDRRAKSTRSWLINHGVSASRLTAEGYGETHLLNRCSDGVNCSEEDHQFNRRSEFIVIE